MVAVSAPVTMRMTSMLDVITWVPVSSGGDGLCLGTNVRKRIGHFFLAAVPMVFPLFSESAFVEIRKVPSNYLIRVRSCKFPLLIVFSQPGLSNENRPVFTFCRYLDVVNLNLSEKKFCQIRLR